MPEKETFQGFLWKTQQEVELSEKLKVYFA